MGTRYIPHTPAEVKSMLHEIGVENIEALFSDLPSEHRVAELQLPRGLSEQQVLVQMKDWGNRNINPSEYGFFLGGGIYRHTIPCAISPLAQRGEFLTAYTPYQPEVSQGSLQLFFEFQTMVSELTGMEVANASMYDGGTAAAEAMLMACRVSRKYRFLVSSALHPEYIQVIRTYAIPQGIEIEEVPFDVHTGMVDIKSLKKRLDDRTAGFLVGYPNFFGIVEDIRSVRQAIGDAILAVHVNPIALGILEAPGKMGADIVTGEGQPLGAPPYLGGMSLGLFATRSKYIRQMPGRVIGQTSDVDGNRGYVMVLQTREQHIRRSKATSNICSNHAHNALVATIFLALMGKAGIREMAFRSTQKAHYLANRLDRMERFERKFSGPFFNEFVFESQVDPVDIESDLLSQNYLGPLVLRRFYADPFFHNLGMLAVTETNPMDDIHFLASRMEAMV